MNIYLSHQSAVDFWRNCASIDVCEQASMRVVSDASAGANCAEEYALSRFGIRTDCVHVLVGSAGARRQSKKCACHVVGNQLPMGSFYKLAAHVYVTSPELTLTHMASVLDRIDLIKLVCEFCGTYRIGVDGQGCVCDGIEPLTSLRQLAAYGRRYGSVAYAKGLGIAVGHSFDNSGSPKETELAMRLCLPCNMGGYAMPRPELNVKFILPLDIAYRIGRSFFRCDLYWKSHNIAVEYDSDLWHSGEEKIADDALRRNILEGRGIRMLTATSEQLASVVLFDVFARGLMRMLGHRHRTNCSDWVARRRRLHEKLLHGDDESPGRQFGRDMNDYFG